MRIITWLRQKLFGLTTLETLEVLIGTMDKKSYENAPNFQGLKLEVEKWPQNG